MFCCLQVPTLGEHMVNTLEKNNEGAGGTALVSGEFPNNVPNSLRRALNAFNHKPGSEVFRNLNFDQKSVFLNMNAE